MAENQARDDLRAGREGNMGWNNRTTWPDVKMDADPATPGYVTGVAELFGGNFHVNALRVRVERDRDGISELVVDNAQFEHTFNSVCELCGDDLPQLVTLPGHEGVWLVWVEPFLT
jgi:hypothetical protein